MFNNVYCLIFNRCYHRKFILIFLLESEKYMIEKTIHSHILCLCWQNLLFKPYPAAMGPDVLIHTPDKHMLQDATKKSSLSLWLGFEQRFLAYRHFPHGCCQGLYTLLATTLACSKCSDFQRHSRQISFMVLWSFPHCKRQAVTQPLSWMDVLLIRIEPMSLVVHSVLPDNENSQQQV